MNVCQCIQNTEKEETNTNKHKNQMRCAVRIKQVNNNESTFYSYLRPILSVFGFTIIFSILKIFVQKSKSMTGKCCLNKSGTGENLIEDPAQADTSHINDSKKQEIEI